MNRRSLFKLAFGAAAYPVLKPLEKLVPKPETYSTYLYPKDFISGLEKCSSANLFQEWNSAKTMQFVSYNVRYTMGAPPSSLYVRRIKVPEDL